MHRGFRKTTAWGLLLLMATPVFFSAGILFKQKILQLKRRARFETEMMQSISVNINDFQWIKKGKEARINGKLFDVKSCTVSGNRVYATGFFDGKEEQLVEQLHELNLEKNDPSKSSRNFSFIKFAFTAVYTESEPPPVQYPWHYFSRVQYDFTEIIQERTLAADIPPPKIG